MIFKSKRSKARRPKLRTGRRVSVTSYYTPKKTSKNDNNSSKPKAKSTKNRISNFVSRLTSLLLVVVIGAMLIFASTLSNNPVVQLSKGQFNYHSKSEYSLAAKNILEKSLLNKSKLFFRSASFENSMQEEFPEIKHIDAILPLAGRDLTVSISVSSPFAIIQNGQNKMIMDGKGVIVDKYTTVPGSIHLLTISMAQELSSLKLGSRVMTKEEVGLLQLLNSEVSTITLSGKDSSLNIESILLDVSNREAVVELVDTGFYIKLSTYSSKEEQVGSLKATLLKLDREASLPSNYIDVRVPGRVFIK